MDNTDPVRVGIELAAKWVDERREAYDREHGSIDLETGALEFGSHVKAEYSAELFEIAEGIRAVTPPAQPAYELPNIDWKAVSDWVQANPFKAATAEDFEALRQRARNRARAKAADTGPAAEADPDAVMQWLSACHTIHTDVQTTYVVTGYEVTIERDGSPIAGPFVGRSLIQAYAEAMRHYNPAEPEPASIACEDCGGAGVVGDEIPQGEFQPPERERCESCNGSGRWAKVRLLPFSVMDHIKTTEDLHLYVQECIREHQQWIKRVRDELLTPLAHQATDLGKLAEGFGQQTVELLQGYTE